MAYWDGTRWAPEPRPSARRSSRLTNWAATLAMLVGLAALLAPIQLVAAGSPKRSPTVSVACDPAACAVGGSMTVSGVGFTPSAGGQQVIMWLGYPDDYCGTDACHGEYFNPWVSSDGRFSVTFSDALKVEGTGVVTAFQYAVKRDKWVQVAKVSYSTY